MYSNHPKSVTMHCFQAHTAVSHGATSRMRQGALEPAWTVFASTTSRSSFGIKQWLPWEEPIIGHYQSVMSWETHICGKSSLQRTSVTDNADRNNHPNGPTRRFRFCCYIHAAKDEKSNAISIHATPASPPLLIGE